MGKDATPRNWPSVIPYLLQPSYAPHITRSQHEIIRSRSSDIITEIPRGFLRGPSVLARIVPITDPSHPAKGQAGLFAARQLPPGSLILPYYGVVHSSLPPYCTAYEQSDYDLWLDRDGALAVDAEKAGNEARFVNDYRGIAARPNSEFKECWDSRRGERCMAVFVLPAGKNAGKKAGAGIGKGEEILVSYGKGFWSKRRDEHQDDGEFEGDIGVL
ncbi:uncharacterized protein GGS22DRAFT_155885 [Annulohypoxylon maeteangense]|uniref:uncharacterized protein n=1 Tax=Annulohypoxylon maeteangense TaxID=1927788 RepID=UPI002008C124|nr:uncharacterized protein GGS22DRAFT_155885 [Annulohypoxylon maeteangense]KAI0888447.1 hypothetical protein GGS22DRAFT_155885 [Annulohypoxylon maeteangense]